MANSRNDDIDRIGNRNTPQGSTTNTPQGREDMDRDRGFEQGRDITNQGGSESFNRDSGTRGTLDTDRENRGSDIDRGTDSSRNSGRDLDDESE